MDRSTDPQNQDSDASDAAFDAAASAGGGALRLALSRIETARLLNDSQSLNSALQQAADALDDEGNVLHGLASPLDAQAGSATCLDEELARANLQLAICLVAAGDFSRAMSSLETALQTYRRLRHYPGEASVLQTLDWLNKARGNHASALATLVDSLARTDRGRRFLEACLQQGRAEPENLCEGQMLCVLAQTHLSRGDTYRAAHCAMGALRYAQATKTSQLDASACEILAKLRVTQGRHEAALHWLQRALRHWTQLQLAREQVAALEWMSRLQEDMGRPEMALSCLRQANAIDAKDRSEKALRQAELMVRSIEAERTRRKEQEALAHTNKLAALGRMVADISHEIMQPVSAIRLLAEEALADPVLELGDDGPSHNLYRILRLVDRLTGFTQQIKAFSYREPLRLKPMVLRPYLEDALAIVEPKRKSCMARIELIAEEVRVVADGDRIAAILVNLLSNALDAVSGSANRRIEVAVETRGQRIDVRVRDHGPGLSDAARLHLFQPFFTQKKPGQGLGIGLSLSREMAQQMNADIRGANHPEGGAEFVVDLVRAQDSDMLETTDSQNADLSTTGPTP